MLVPHYLDYLVYNVCKSGNLSPPTYSSFQDILYYARSIVFRTRFRINLSIASKNSDGILKGFALKIKINLGRMGTETLSRPPVHEYDVSLNLFMSVLTSQLCFIVAGMCDYILLIMYDYITWE